MSEIDTYQEGQPSVRKSDLADQATAYLIEMQKVTGRADYEMQEVGENVDSYLETRANRAIEIMSPEVVEARRQTAEYYEEPLRKSGVLKGEDEKLFVGDHTCMDVRTRSTVQTGRPAKGGGTAGGGSMRFSGGKPSGVHPDGFGGELVLDEESTYARELSAGLFIPAAAFQQTDSHFHCKKALVDAQGHSHTPADNGLMRDVEYKVKLMKVIGDYSRKLGIQQSYFMHTAFDPHNGFWTLGLNLPRNIQFAAGRGGYTDQVLDKLAKNKDIIHMEQLVYGKLQGIFLENYFPADWSNNYAETALNFADNLTTMKGTATSQVIEEFQKLYRKRKEVDVNLFARSALANGYNAWLLNVQGRYPYQEHNEEVVVALVGGEYGPFPKTESLEIFRDDPYMAADAHLASGIIRTNRVEGRVQGHPDSPVPLIIQGRVREILDPSDLNSIQETAAILNEHLPDLNWQNWTYENFNHFMAHQFPHLSAAASHAIVRLGTSMNKIYNPRDRYFDVFNAGSVIGVPTLVGPNREPLAVLNFYPKKQRRNN